MEKKILPVMGMACAACSANVERKLKMMDGVKSVAVSLPGRTAMVEYDERVVTPKDMKRIIDGAGYLLIIDDETRVDALERNAYRQLKRRMILSWLLALLTMLMHGASLYIALPIWTRLWLCPLSSRSASACSIPFVASSSGDCVA